MKPHKWLNTDRQVTLSTELVGIFLVITIFVPIFLIIGTCGMINSILHKCY